MSLMISYQILLNVITFLFNFLLCQAIGKDDYIMVILTSSLSEAICHKGGHSMNLLVPFADSRRHFEQNQNPHCVIES